MTDDELQAIEARANAATPGPWQHNSKDTDRWYEPVVAPSGALFSGEQFNHDADGPFIASARTDVPALVKEVRRAAAVIRAIIDASDHCQGHADCAHGMKPWFDARELLYLFDNEQEALAELRSRAAHERYRE